MLRPFLWLPTPSGSPRMGQGATIRQGRPGHSVLARGVGNPRHCEGIRPSGAGSASPVRRTVALPMPGRSPARKKNGMTLARKAPCRNIVTPRRTWVADANSFLDGGKAAWRTQRRLETKARATARGRRSRRPRSSRRRRTRTTPLSMTGRRRTRRRGGRGARANCAGHSPGTRSASGTRPTRNGSSAANSTSPTTAWTGTWTARAATRPPSSLRASRATPAC